MRKKSILFLCTHNSCRSQMAEGWTRYRHGNRFEVFSAGTEKRIVDPRAIVVMRESGVDVSWHTSKTIAELTQQKFDYVITVCSRAQEACPNFSGKAKVVHVEFDDPPALAKEAKSEEEALVHYRRVRDEIRAFIENLPDILNIKR